MAFKPTAEQKSAIITNGNVLVAAAAGSGKTAVLVERVINRLTSKTAPISADRLLIVTFTNAAAAEMRTRIEKRLDEVIRENPNDFSLITQKYLLSSASICTIDSFCINLVRENFEKLNISPDFKISDNNSLKSVDERVLYSIISKYFEEQNSNFNLLLDIIGAEYDESNLIELILNIYYYSRQLADPVKWFESLADMYSNGFTKDSSWYKYCFSYAINTLKNAKQSIEYTTDLIAVYDKAKQNFTPNFISAKEKISELLKVTETNDWNEFLFKLSSFKLDALPVIRGLNEFEDVIAAKEIYKYLNTKMPESLKKIFFADLSFINLQFEKIYPAIKLLTEILKEFDAAIFEEYKSLNTLTFHNTEHLALKLLTDDSLSEEFSKKFDEVMVDEYQDTNDLQDKLFNILSNNEEKLFVVGDVKQSIYAFRGANPKNFLLKKNRYTPLNLASDNDSKKIILDANFRSKPQVCDFINLFFNKFMNAETGDISYDEEEKLTAAAKYPECMLPPVTLDIIDFKGSNLPERVLEAKQIANYIHTIMNSGPVIKQDENSLRPASFSDFTILLRNPKTHAQIFTEELKRQGIPVNYSTEEFAETIEISTILSLLKIIDNPQSEIELLTAMMSPIFSFSADDLVEIRISKREDSLYSAVIFAANNGHIKAKDFIDQLEKMRLFSVTMPLAKFISYLINLTGYDNIVTAMTEGSRRKKNLLLLCNYAEEFSKNDNPSISSFIHYINNQSKRGLHSALSSSGEDTVKLMSIHASKGLQFPVCILAGTTSDFNDNEARINTIYNTEDGLGLRYFDEELKEKLTTVSREVIHSKLKSQRLEEEMRLLYVAMTRTKDFLHFTATLSNSDKKLSELKSILISSGDKIDASFLSRTKSYFDWLGIVCLNNPEEIKINRIDGNYIKNLMSRDFINKDNVNLTLSKQISENLKYTYPYNEITKIESKTSVSLLANSAEGSKYLFSDMPSFINSEKISPAERGTAIHKVMQYFNFENYLSYKEELERLYEWQYISESEYNSINLVYLSSFFKSKIFHRIIKSPLVKKEMRFLTEIPASVFLTEQRIDISNENVIIQGAVDICFIENNEIVILDFKTDRVENPQQLIETYSEQLNIYAIACEKIFKMPVKEKIIYSFALNQEIKV